MLNLRLPYMGSKNAISVNLIEQMRLHKPKAKYFYDLFGGGGSMSFTALQMGYTVIYNEYDTGLSNFMAFLIDRVARKEKSKYGLLPEEYYKFVTREIFKEQVDLNTNYAEFCRVVYSFGNNRKSYLFNPEIEKIKHIAHNIVVFNCSESLKEFNSLIGVDFILSNQKTINERRLFFMSQVLKSQKIDRFDIQNLERLENLEQLQNLQQLQKLQRLNILNKSYDDILIPFKDDDVIIYCDPPYRGTAEYRELFSHADFDKWVKEHDKTIFISEYDTPFYPIFEINKRVTMSSTVNSKVAKEILFCNRPLRQLNKQISLFTI